MKKKMKNENWPGDHDSKIQLPWAHFHELSFSSVRACQCDQKLSFGDQSF